MKFKLKFKLDFFKRNPLISSIIGTAVFISLLMIYMIHNENSARLESDQKLDDLKNKISLLNATTPYPSEKNIELIKSDILSLKVNTYILEDIFGNIYTKPLMAFIRSLNNEDIRMLQAQLTDPQNEGSNLSQGQLEEAKKRLLSIKNMTDEQLAYDFINSWKLYIDEEKKAKSELSVGEIFNNFRKYKKYKPEEFDLARKAFLNEFQKLTLEQLNKETIDDYILASLGIPLDFSRIRCKNIVSNIESELNRIIAVSNVHIADGKLTLFTEYSSVPDDDDIPYIINYCRFLEDLFQRIAKSEIGTIEAYKKINGIKGYEDANFLIFEYQIDLISSMETLRALLNDLQTAYKENRVYIIKSLKLSVLEDNANSLPPYKGKTQDEDQSKQIKILLGSSDNLRASIVINYVMFKKKVF